MNKKNLIFYIILYIMCLCTITGCVRANSKEKFNIRNPKYNSRGNGALEYLETKYNKKFYPISYGLGGYLSDVDEAEFYTDGMDPEHERIHVRIEPDKFKCNYSDSYFWILVRPEMERLFCEFVDQQFGEYDYKLYTDASTVPAPDNLDENNTLDDLLKEKPDLSMGFTAYVKYDGKLSKEEFEDKVKNLEDSIMASNKYICILLYVVDEEDFNKISRFDNNGLIAYDLFSKEDTTDRIKYKYSLEYYPFDEEFESNINGVESKRKNDKYHVNVQ